MVAVGADPIYLEEPDRWGTAFVCGAVPCLSLLQEGSTAEPSVSSSTSSSPSTDTGALQFLQYLLEPAVPEAPSPPFHIPSWKLLPAFASDPCRKHWTDPPWQTRSSSSAWPGDPRWPGPDTAGRDWLQVPGETLPLGCPWHLAKPSVLQARHAVYGDGSPRYFHQGCLATRYLFRLLIAGWVGAFPWAQLLGSSRSVSCFPEQKWEWIGSLPSLCFSDSSSLTACAVAPLICGEDAPHSHPCPEGENLIWGNCCPVQSIRPLSRLYGSNITAGVILLLQWIASIYAGTDVLGSGKWHLL